MSILEKQFSSQKIQKHQFLKDFFNLQKILKKSEKSLFYSWKSGDIYYYNKRTKYFLYLILLQQWQRQLLLLAWLLNLEFLRN